MIHPRDVALLTVTYANRLDSLIPMVEAVAAQGIRYVTVVGNGITPPVQERLLAYRFPPDLELVLIVSPFNAGSAPGYAQGMSAVFSRGDTVCAWLMDDDNRPAPDCLVKLLAALNADPRGAVCALRADLPYLVEVARRGDAETMALRAGQIFNHDVRRLAARAARKLMRRADFHTNLPAPLPGPIPIPRAPYSGIMIPRRTYEQTGGPLESLVLYADDLEFSERLAATEGGLRLIPDARVTDVEASWNMPEKPQRASVLLASAKPDFRLFYAVRNAVFLDVRRHGFSLWLIPNAAYFLCCVTAVALWKGRPRNAWVVARGFLHGVTGRLGLDARFPLPA